MTIICIYLYESAEVKIFLFYEVQYNNLHLYIQICNISNTSNEKNCSFPFGYHKMGMVSGPPIENYSLWEGGKLKDLFTIIKAEQGTMIIPS